MAKNVVVNEIFSGSTCMYFPKSNLPLILEVDNLNCQLPDS